MAPGTTSKDLLNLERKTSASSSLESALLFCKNGSLSETQTNPTCGGKLVTTPVPTSQVLGKVRDFLGVMAEANKRLQNDAKENSSKEYDIETLSGKEKEYIEMDLVLGVADLNTPEAVAAAESALAGSQPKAPLASNSSGSDTDCSDNEDSNDEDSDEDDDDDEEMCLEKNEKVKKSDKIESLSTGQRKKRQKIIEL